MKHGDAAAWWWSKVVCCMVVALVMGRCSRVRAPISSMLRCVRVVRVSEMEGFQTSFEGSSKIRVVRERDESVSAINFSKGKGYV